MCTETLNSALTFIILHECRQKLKILSKVYFQSKVRLPLQNLTGVSHKAGAFLYLLRYVLLRTRSAQRNVPWKHLPSLLQFGYKILREMLVYQNTRGVHDHHRVS